VGVLAESGLRRARTTQLPAKRVVSGPLMHLSSPIRPDSNFQHKSSLTTSDNTGDAPRPLFTIHRPKSWAAAVCLKVASSVTPSTLRATKTSRYCVLPVCAHWIFLAVNRTLQSRPTKPKCADVDEVQPPKLVFYQPQMAASAAGHRHMNTASPP
jgi:hypothetical protein